MFGFIKYRLKLKLFQRKFRKQNQHNFMQISSICDLNHIKVGINSYGSINIVDFSSTNSQLVIGNYCSIGGNVQFLLGGEHNLYAISTYPFKVMKFGENREAASKGSIVLKDDVWLGQNAIICSGITIGQGAVVAAGAVVTKDVKPYAIVGGNPARLIRYRFDENLRAKLEQMDVASLFDKFKKEDMSLVYSKLDDEVLEKILKLSEK